MTDGGYNRIKGDISWIMGTIKCSSVSKSFRKIEAVRGVTLLVNSGEVAALIGPNGAGKSTLMKMMVGLV